MTESFEDARIFAQVIMSDCDAPIISRLQKAHDHEMEQLRRSQFREGYEAGQRSMDAEHYAVALRLKHLPLDEDSHGNLSQIARAIWHSDFGWTRGACKTLRDELVRLLGGVHDEPAPIPASGCACDADCDCGNQQPQAVAYDVLGNERHKAITELRKVRTELDESVWTWIEDVAIAIGAQDKQSDEYESMLPKITCRLIHLLGGDEPDLQESPNLANCDTENGGEVTITDELRKFKGHINAGLTPEMVLALRAEINYIADRIDEMERKLRKQRDGFRRGMFAAQDLLEKRTDERDELRKSLREIAERVGVPHDVDLDEYSDYLVAKATLGKIDSTHEYIGALEWQRDRQRKLLDEYENADTPEEIVRDIHLGIATDSQAIERIRSLS